MKLKKSIWNSAISLTIVLSISACKKVEEKNSFPLQSQIIGLATPFQLEPDSSLLFLEDYFLNAAEIDSIILPEGLTFKRKNEIAIIFGNISKPIESIKIRANGFYYDILIKKNNKVLHTFSYTPPTELKFKTLGFAGSVNGWVGNKNLLVADENGSYSTSFILAPGTYPYQIEVDGVKRTDWNADSVSNGNGGYNSLMKVGEENQNKNLLTFSKFENGNLHISTKLKADEAFVFWENYLIPHKIFENNTIQFSIPAEAKNVERSYIRVFSYNGNSLSNDVLIPLSNGAPISDIAQLKRDDKHTFIMYFLMVDRFFNGNNSNDMPLKRPDVHPKADYFGGDIEGVSKKVAEGYFTDLGVNTIWLSPITQNPIGPWGKYPNPETQFSGYHGYWPISSSKVDFRFGTAESLEDLIEKSHNKNCNILIDYVANHVHMEHPAYVNNPDWATSLYLPDGTMNTEKWDEHRLTTWFDTFLATLDFSKPEVLEAMTDSALFWFQQYKIDGFRHDATKHIDLPFWRMLTQKLKKQVIRPTGRNLYQIGETYGSAELINSYVNSGMLDAQFDFNLYDAAVSVFAQPNTSFSVLEKTLGRSLETYGYHHLMGNISGNQDRARFISYADGSVRFDEDAKLAGWTREINVKDTLAYRKLAQLQTFNLTIPGIPVIYYGDEYGSPGGNDPDNRRQMQFENLSKHELELRNEVSGLTKTRNQSLALLYGNFEIVNATDDMLIFKRTYWNETVIVGFNKTKEVKIFESKENNITLNIKPYSYEIIKL